jgi:hypothetical protein
MNERIKELTKQSGLEIYGLGLDREKWIATVSNFAELIIQECLIIIDNSEGDVDYAKFCLTNEFGVER